MPDYRAISQINRVRNHIIQAIADIQNSQIMDMNNSIEIDNAIAQLNRSKDDLQTLAEELSAQ